MTFEIFFCARGSEGARQMSEWTQRAGHQDVGAIQVNDNFLCK
jgi:hypothetical protein